MIKLNGAFDNNYILFSGYRGNLHKSDDHIVFVHAIDLDRRPVVLHPRKCRFEKTGTLMSVLELKLLNVISFRWDGIL